jgi:hypothetical protein
VNGPELVAFFVVGVAIMATAWDVVDRVQQKRAWKRWHRRARRGGPFDV